MSFLVCHVQKFKASDVKGMQIHDQRESENSKNTDIDRSRTNLNYDLHNGANINYNHKVKNIIKEGYKGSRAIRKDAVVMTGTLISSDKEFFNKLSSHEQKDFFKNAYDKLKDIYGEKNIVSAVVHMDEHTPHMHLCSVPLAEGKLSAKTLFNREGLRVLQEELPKYLKSKGFDIKRGESSERKHVDTIEYKKQQAKDLEKEIDKSINTLKTDLEALQDTKTSLWELEHLETKKSLIGAKITFPEGDFNKIIDMAKKGVLNSDEISKLKDENTRLKDDVSDYRNWSNKAGNTISQLQSDNKKLHKDLKRVKQQGKVMYDTLGDHDLIPEAQERYKTVKEAEKIAEKVLRSPDIEWER